MLNRTLLLVVVSYPLVMGQSAPIAAQTAEVANVLTTDLAKRLTDRVSLEESAPILTDVIAQVASAPLEEVQGAAERHSAARREDISVSAGKEAVSYSVYRDLIRFPEVNRGKAVQLGGVCRSVSTLGGDPLSGVHLIDLTPADAPSGQVLILAEPDIAALQVGKRLEVLGVFTNLVQSPKFGDKAVPVVVARRVTPESADGDLLVDKSLWSVVKDRTLGVRISESNLYYRLLHQVKGLSDATLRSAASRHVQARKKAVPRLRERTDFPVFVDMFQNPNDYRGEVVTLEGYAREVRKYPAGANAEGIETLYETWIYTDDSQSNPAVVVSTQISDNLPIGDDLQVPVRTTGYFFKIYGYQANDTTRVAPMILAGSVERATEPRLSGPPWWFYCLGAGIFIALLIWMIASYRNERRRTRVIDNSSPDFDGLS